MNGLMNEAEKKIVKTNQVMGKILKKWYLFKLFLIKMHIQIL